ncbi:(R)-mandelonitrile lyase [Botryobacter ruber]|uniref:(R)-mandelonitrile lyase n=1 Tax=Botryobacter ruber TaxID=2171629 RepID=UPI000E0A76B0|nr:cupin domain-containing protein [Botryobacter ruber]
MKTRNIQLSLGFALASAALLTAGCQEQTTEREPESAAGNATQAIFQKGEKAPAENFTGTAWVTNLVAPDSIYTTATGSVVFEAGARTNWHSHPPGQLLLVTEGVGYHQIEGEHKQTIRKGDVVKCPPNVTHWHGATPDSSMTHIYIVPNTDEGIVNWKQPVTDEEFNRKN